MSASEHPAFPLPQDPTTRIWRYMDFTKFISMLEAGGLFFSRADLLGDPFEGSFPVATISRRPDAFGPAARTFNEDGDPVSAEELAQEAAFQLKKVPRFSYVSCWHASNFESAAMWKLYSSSHEAIAVVSRYWKLTSLLDEACFVGAVKYIDYTSDTVDDWNMFSGLMHKRSSFEHEKEIRAITLHPTIGSPDVSSESEEVTVDLNALPAGLWKEVSLDTLIEKIRVSPSSPAWFGSLVASIASRYKLSAPVQRSDLETEPLF